MTSPRCDEMQTDVLSQAQKNTGATARAFDLIMLCERECGCGGRLSRERDGERTPCSYVVTGESASHSVRGDLGAGAEPAKGAMMDA